MSECEIELNDGRINTKAAIIGLYILSPSYSLAGDLAVYDKEVTPPTGGIIIRDRPSMGVG